MPSKGRIRTASSPLFGIQRLIDVAQKYVEYAVLQMWILLVTSLVLRFDECDVGLFD